jgi:hypothetical protein
MKQIQIKTSKKLNDMLNELASIEWMYVDEILTESADYYTILDKTSPEEGVKEGFALCEKAMKAKKPVYDVFCEEGWSAYFIGELPEITKILNDKLEKARQQAADDERENLKEALETTKKKVKILEKAVKESASISCLCGHGERCEVCDPPKYKRKYK